MTLVSVLLNSVIVESAVLIPWSTEFTGLTFEVACGEGEILLTFNNIPSVKAENLSTNNVSYFFIHPSQHKCFLFCFLNLVNTQYTVHFTFCIDELNSLEFLNYNN